LTKIEAALYFHTATLSRRAKVRAGAPPGGAPAPALDASIRVLRIPARSGRRAIVLLSSATPGRRSLRFLILAVVCGACAHAGGPPPQDATQDPDFQAALKRAKPDFPRQRDALAAGLYEPFVPPESLPASPPGGLAAPDRADSSSSASRAESRTPSSAGRPPSPSDEVAAAAASGSSARASGSAVPSDPSTEDLLRTLPPGPRARTPAAAPAPAPATARDEPEDDREAFEPPPSGEAPAPASIETPAPDGDDPESALGDQGIDAVAGPYVIQVGAFSDAAAAARRAEEARAAAPDLPVEVRRQDGWLKVFVGSFASREEGAAALSELGARGLGGGWVTRVSR
jgi:DedD protein